VSEGAPRLDGATVVVTRRRDDVAALIERLETAGARAACTPMIHFAPPADPAPLAAARQQIADFDWLVLTSRYAARALLEALPAAATERPRVAALGKSTAAVVAELGWAVDLDVGGAGADALAEQLIARHALDGSRVLYPLSSLARSKLPAILQQAGADVRQVVAYQTLPPEPAARAELARNLDATQVLLVFASPSAVQHADAVVSAHAIATWSSLRVISIGPTTSRALRELGAQHISEAQQPDDDGLMDAIAAAWAAIGDSD